MDWKIIRATREQSGMGNKRAAEMHFSNGTGGI
jgi:hypothetical protein